MRPGSKNFSVMAGVFVCLLASAVLVGWAADIQSLKSVVSGWETMKVSTAGCFLLCGWALILQGKASRAAGVRRAVMGFAAGVMFIAPGSYLFLDAGSMSGATALNFLLVGVAVLLMEWCAEKECLVSCVLALLETLIALLAFAGYVYGVDSLYAVSLFSSMAVHTAFCFMVLGLGLLSAHQGEHALLILTREGRGGRLVRFLLPLAMIVPIVVGWFLLQLEHAGYFDYEFGLAVFAVILVVLFSTLIWMTANWVDRTDAKVREGDLRYQNLIESLPQLVWTCEADGECDYLSPQWVAYTGVPEEAQLGYGWLERVHVEDRARTHKSLEKAFKNGESFDDEFRIQRYDGEYCWFKTRCIPQKNAEGRVVKWFGTNTDIDQRRQAEDQAKASFKALEDLKMALDEHAIVAITDAEGKILSVNDKFCELSQYAREDLIGRDHRIVNSNLHPKEFFRNLWETIRDGKTWRGEIRNQCLDGSYYWVDTTIVPLCDSQGRPEQYIAIRADITKLKEAEEEIRLAYVAMEAQVALRTAELNASNLELVENAKLLSEAQRIGCLGSWNLDTATGKVYWSKELFQIVGLDPEQEPPDYPRQEKMFSPESWKLVTQVVDKAMSEGAGYEVELEVFRPDGSRRWAIARGEAVVNEEGEIVRLTGTFQDITELKQALIKLEHYSERLTLASEAASIGVWDWDISGNTLTWDEIMHTLFGTEGPVSFAIWKEMVLDEDVQETEEKLKLALSGEQAFQHTFRIRRPDGEIRFVYGVGVVHFDAEGKAIRMVGVNMDVTSEKEFEYKLRASEKLLQDFVWHAPAAIAMMDLNMCYLQASEQWLDDYKLTKEEIIGKCHYDIFPDIPERWKECHRRVLKGAVEYCDEDPFPQPDGRMEWLQWEVRPWHLSDGSIGGLLFFTQFITERKEMELKLREQKNLLENSNRDLEQFAYVASHDLQEPLRAVSGCVQIFQKRYSHGLDQGAEELVHHIVEGVDRMRGLINDLLAYSRVGTRGKVFSAIESKDCLISALANLEVAIREREAEILYADLPRVMADPVQLTQLFQNLIGNALKYQTDSRPKIEIEAKGLDEKGLCQFSIKDNGIGIDPRYYERIFLLFQRLHTRDEFSGTGIGLPLCKKIIERHGGRIWVDSSVGKGSTFSFTLPAES
ncbi:PAS domain-containing protein [Kiritimatiellaeota bacterium B1221]|nr:PAS domain-containing protein [Kiritimatiellaeota bacterium B1221]